MRQQSEMYYVAFYLAFVAILIMNRDQLLDLSKHDIIIVGACISMMLVISFTMNRRYVETFQDDAVANSVVSTTTSDGSAQLDDDSAVTINEYHIDKLIQEEDIHPSNVVFYFSCFSRKSMDLVNKQWSDINNPDNKIAVDTTDTMTTIYHQKKGLNMGTSQLIGYESSKLLLHSNLRQFSLLFYCKMNFNKNAVGTYNLFEMYSGNVSGNIAFSIKLKKETDSGFKIKVNFAGLRYIQNVSDDTVFVSDKDSVISIVKSVESGNMHRLVVKIDNVSVFIKTIDYADIKYVSTTRDVVELSKERFVLNKQKEGSDKELISYNYADIVVYNLIMLNTSIVDRTVENIVKNLKYQRDTQLNPEVVRLNQEVTALKSNIETTEANLDSLNTCKLSSEVCEQCTDVVWSDFSSISKSESCVDAMTKKCKDIRNGLQSYSELEGSLCQLLDVPKEQPACSNVTPPKQDVDYSDSNIKNIEVDYQSRNEHATGASLSPNTPSVTPLSANIDGRDDTPQAPTAGVNSFINDTITTPMNMTEDVYSNIMKQYEKDIDEAKSKIDAEDELDAETNSSSLTNFLKYMFFMKT